MSDRMNAALLMGLRSPAVSQFLEVPMDDLVLRKPRPQPAPPRHRYRLEWRANGVDTADSPEARRLIEQRVRWLCMGRALNWDGSPYRPVAWEDHEKDVAELARDTPGWDFELAIAPADHEAVICRKAFRDGRVFDREETVAGWSEARSPQPWEPEVVEV